MGIIPTDPPDEDPEQAEHFRKMQVGCVNSRIRFIYWDPHQENYIAITPEFLMENGPPYNHEAGEYCIFNSAQLVQ